MLELLPVLVLCLIAMALTFFAVCCVCDEHLVPAIEVFIVQFNIPEDVAGVTLIAFGAAAPELVLNMISGAEGTSDLSLSALLGSSIIAFGLIPPCCILMTPHKEVELKAWPILREVIFYMLGLGVFLIVMQDGELTVREAGVSVGIYVIYVLLVVVSFFMPEKQGGGGASNTAANVDGAAREGLLEGMEMANMGASTNGSSPKAPSVTTTTGNGNLAQRISSHNHGDKEDSSMPLPLKFNKEDGKGSSFPNDGAHVGDEDDAHTELLGTGGSESLSKAAGSSPSHSLSLGVGLAFEGEDVENIAHIPQGLQANAMMYTKNVLMLAWGKMSPAVMTAWKSATSPIAVVVGMTIPTLHLGLNDDGEPKRVPFLRACSALGMAVVWVALLAWVIIGLSELLIKFAGVGTSTVGATLVALGSEIPDLVASVALARNGYHDGAMAGAIGSQVINITLGVGLPILVSFWYTGTSIHINHHETRALWLLTLLLLFVILGYTAITLPLTFLRKSTNCRVQQYTNMKRQAAWYLVFLLVAVNLAFIFINEEVMDDITDDEMKVAVVGVTAAAAAPTAAT